MQRITAIFDGLRFSESTLHYAVLLAKQQQAHLTGVFPEDPTYNSFSLYHLFKSGAGKVTIKILEDIDREARGASAARFEAACQKSGISYNIRQDKNISILSVLEESIYADLMILDVQETFVRSETPPPTRFVKDVLTDVQCPVLLVPHDPIFPPVHTEIENVVLLYDGEPSSVYAIKMYNYLLSSFKDLPTVVLSVNENGTGTHLENRKQVKDFVKRHFPQATYKVMEGNAEESITAYLKRQPSGTLAVLGAYRRGNVSRWFRESMADVLMDNVVIPLFVAHNK
ncbi:MAG TPA: hypothetical protein VM802_03165 [Chitinophaga sp.]|uniref:universal stress protein n=1 Tax=Chitinophaga sp. TaxID=1869181 RepID=UPI002BFB4390|nr:universal stress protein [Chitinophaga sp.]HVI43835.1 hypothetical protein [Chitinophaga sp.]